MATYYLDFENGNDASSGADWANAWKTLNNGATSARIAPGDEIRIAKTADPTSIGNATWTTKSATVTLASAQTTNIYLDGSWTAANSGTATTNTDRKEGSNAASITTSATTATATKYAYLTVGGASGLDLSSYDAITFWIQNPAVTISANHYQIKLCSDTTGDTAVDEFDIPAIASKANWVPLTLTRIGGGNLGNAIKSIAWYTGSSSPGNSRNTRLDNISACSSTGLNLQSLISKNSSGFTDVSIDDTWHGLQSINGTTVILGKNNGGQASDAALRGYWTSGSSPATVTTYIRPTFKFAMQNSSTSSAQPLQDDGTAGNLITYSGGWNTSSNTQDGETWIDGQNGLGYGIDIANSRTYIKIERLNSCRFSFGLRVGTSAGLGCVIDNCIFINNSTGLHTGGGLNSIKCITNNNDNAAQVGTATTSYNLDIKSLNNAGAFSYPTNSQIKKIIHNNSSATLNLSMGSIDYLEFIDNATSITADNSQRVFIKEAIVQNNTGSTGLVGNSNSNITINKLTVSNNAAVGTLDGLLVVKQHNGLSTQLLGSGSTSAFRNPNYPNLMYNAVNNNVNDNRYYYYWGNGLSQTTTRHTASGIAWQINITNTAQNTSNPLYFPIAKVACNASSLVTVKAWVKLSHATDIGAKLMIQANEIAGVSADVTATKAADTNWEELTITFTPTVAGVAQIYVQGYWLANLADESIYVDDVTVTQA